MTPIGKKRLAAIVTTVPLPRHDKMIKIKADQRS